MNITPLRERIVQKAIQIVLERIYEPKFITTSHGFRPYKGCHSALEQISQTFNGVVWVVEVDITKCFDSVNHLNLIDILAKTITCKKTLKLIKRCIKAGYTDLSSFVEQKHKGTLQGSVLSPLFCNIYMHELDVFMDGLINEYSSKRYRKSSNEYHAVMRFIRKTSSLDFYDSNYCRVQYVRYANNFVIGIIGPYATAVQIQSRITNFLKTELSLEMNKGKIKITPFRRKFVKFLGAEIKQPEDVQSKPIRRKWSNRQDRCTDLCVTPQVILYAPIRQIINELVIKGILKWKNCGRQIRGTRLS